MMAIFIYELWYPRFILVTDWQVCILGFFCVGTALQAVLFCFFFMKNSLHTAEGVY